MAVWAAMIRVEDGQTIHETPSMVVVSLGESGYALGESSAYLLEEAANRVVDRLLVEFTVVPRQISVSGRKALRTARWFRKGRWEYSGKFRTDDEMMFLVLRLPSPADRNIFEVSIRREDDGPLVAQTEIIWDRWESVRSLEFSPRDLAERGGGPGKFVAVLSLRGEQVAKRKFKIVRPDKTPPRQRPESAPATSPSR